MSSNNFKLLESISSNAFAFIILHQSKNSASFSFRFYIFTPNIVDFQPARNDFNKLAGRLAHKGLNFFESKLF